MANSTFTKGSTIEVTCNHPIFRNAWYVATIINELKTTPTKNTKNPNKTSYIITYNTLFSKQDNILQPLTEVVDPLFVRPSPPRTIRRNEDDVFKVVEVVEGEGEGGGEFEVGDVVDAYYRDGWWIGVVKSVMVDEGGVKKFHVDWVDCRWMIPPKKVYSVCDCCD
ncbi:putative Agenet-like domain-containing protein [Helianthus debilis subsp. tardiflorus]